MVSQPTVSLSWVQTVLAAAMDQGVSQSALLRQAGLRPEALTCERWPVDHITTLWRAAAQLTGDPGFGLKVGASAGPASFNVVSFMLQSSANLREAAVKLQRYQRLISDGGRFQILAGASASWLVYHPRQGQLAFSVQQIEAAVAAAVTFVCWLSGGAARPLLVRFAHERQGPAADYRKVLGCTVEFDEVFNGILVDHTILDAPFPQAEPQLTRLHEQYALAHLSALSKTETPGAAIRPWLWVNFGPPLPTRAQAARAFGLTERTLARKLREGGQSFSELLDEVRRDLALERVADTAQPLAEIAHALGFADVSPFYRAFHRWVGTTPKRWREMSSEVNPLRSEVS